MNIQIDYVETLIINHGGDHHHRPRLHFIIGPFSEQEITKVPFTQQMTDSQKFDLAVDGGVDKAGQPAPLDGNVVWTVDDTSILELTPDENNPNGVHVRAAGKTGVATITATADAAIGDDVSEISDSAVIDVVAGQAVGFAFSGTGPVEQ